MSTSIPRPSGEPESGADPAIVAMEVAGYAGLPISVRIHRAAGAIPVLLVHGFGSSARANWSATGWLGSLARAGLTVVTVDLRGHGLSGRPHLPGSYSLPIILTDLRQVLAALPGVLGPVPQSDLVGYSMGGRVAAEMIATATGSGLGADRGRWESLPAIRRAVIGGYDGRPLFEGLVIAEFEAALAGLPGPMTASRRIAAIALAARGNDLAALSALVEGLGMARTSLPAGAVPVPTLVVAGERDGITGGTRRWAAGLPDGRHLELPGRNHISAVTSAVFRSAAVDFLTA